MRNIIALLMVAFCFKAQAQVVVLFDQLNGQPQDSCVWDVVEPPSSDLQAPTTYNGTVDFTNAIYTEYVFRYLCSCSDTIGVCQDSSRLTVYLNPCDGFEATINPIANFCSGDNVIATASAVNGLLPYTYMWSNGQATQSFTIPETASNTANLPVTYNVTVTDSNGCTAVDTESFTVLSLPDVTVSVTDALCGSNGEICFDFVDHISRSTIRLSTDGGATYVNVADNSGQYCQQLPPGTYSTATIWGNNQCPVDLGPYTINDLPSDIAIVPTVVDETCNNENTMDGSISLAVTGGSGTYTYLWGGGQTTSIITGLSVGPYSVTVTDDNGCTGVQFPVVGDLNSCCPSFNLTADITNEVCNANGTQDGEVLINVNGGTPGYTYNWSNSTTSNPATGLSAGTYSVTVTDSASCTDELNSIVVGDDNDCCLNGVTFTEQFGSPSQTCNTQRFFNWIDLDCTCCTGTFTITYTEYMEYPAGSGTIIYSGTSTETENCNTALDPQVPLNVCLLDANVLFEVGITITSVVASDPDCDTSHLIGLSYDRTDFITQGWFDACGCNPCPGFTITGNVTDETCGTDTPPTMDGAIDITVSGGVVPYTYNWSNGQSTQDISGLGADAYSVTVTDDSGCTEAAGYTVSDLNNCTDPCDDFNASISVSGCTLTAIASNGQGPYTYSWAPTGQSSQSITASLDATYTVTITDSNGCTDTASVFVSCAPPPLCNSAASITASGCLLTASVTNCPSPSITFFYSSNGTAYSVVGTGTTHNAVLDGFYLVQVTGCPNCTIIISNPIQVTGCAPCNLTASINESPACTLNAVAGNVTGTIAYDWSTSETTSSITVASDNTFTVTITDDGVPGCTAVATYTTVGCEPITCDCDLSLTVDDLTCPTELIWSTTGDCSNYSGQMQYSLTGSGWAIVQPPFILANTSGTYDLHAGGYGDGFYRIVYVDQSSQCGPLQPQVEVELCDLFCTECNPTMAVTVDAPLVTIGDLISTGCNITGYTIELKEGSTTGPTVLTYSTGGFEYVLNQGTYYPVITTVTYDGQTVTSATDSSLADCLPPIVVPQLTCDGNNNGSVLEHGFEFNSDVLGNAPLTFCINVVGTATDFAWDFDDEVVPDNITLYENAIGGTVISTAHDGTTPIGTLIDICIEIVPNTTTTTVFEFNYECIEAACPDCDPVIDLVANPVNAYYASANVLRIEVPVTNTACDESSTMVDENDIIDGDYVDDNLEYLNSTDIHRHSHSLPTISCEGPSSDVNYNGCEVIADTWQISTAGTTATISFTDNSDYLQFKQDIIAAETFVNNACDNTLPSYYSRVIVNLRCGSSCDVDVHLYAFTYLPCVSIASFDDTAMIATFTDTPVSNSNTITECDNLVNQSVSQSVNNAPSGSSACTDPSSIRPRIQAILYSDNTIATSGSATKSSFHYVSYDSGGYSALNCDLTGFCQTASGDWRKGTWVTTVVTDFNDAINNFDIYEENMCSNGNTLIYSIVNGTVVVGP